MAFIWIHQCRLILARACAAALIIASLSSTARCAWAQSPDVDWRGNLSCSLEQQVHDGVAYCVGADDANRVYHVVVADLADPNLRFEYILPKGASDSYSGIKECRDPNVPQWGGPAGGCLDPQSANSYPRMDLAEAVARAREVRSSPSVAAVINGDYAAPNASHGPEGLVVVRGERLDGAANCDDDYNAVVRPWLALGEGKDQYLGVRRATINRLARDDISPPEWVYTAVGGGPWLVRGGATDTVAAGCGDGPAVGNSVPVANCTGSHKSTPSLVHEAYSAGACRAAPHSAAGLSRDGRWLFLVVSTSSNTPSGIARFMQERLGVWSAMKLDGGGSSQMRFEGASTVTVDPLGQNRHLTNYLALYARSGDGLSLPLEGSPSERVYYRVITAGETAEFDLEVQNAGSLSWLREDGVVLHSESCFAQGAHTESLPLASEVAPGEAMSWHWKSGTGAMAFHRFQMYRREEPFGAEFAVIVMTVPKGTEEKRKELEDSVCDLVEEWKAEGEQEIDKLMEKLREHAEEEVRGNVERVLDQLANKIGDTINESCSSLSILALAGLSVAVRSRR